MARVPDFEGDGRALDLEALAAGQVLDGRYRLERKLGEGGMGTVWVARQIALERDVALKVLRASVDTALRSRLRQEALALAAVHHAAVVEVYDYGETREGVPFVVMELVRGESLAHRLARGGVMTAHEAARIVGPLLDGLTAVHAAGIVHRDIKPDNVLLVKDTADVSPKLVDFGIATSRADARATSDARVMGTPAYMSPEQARGLPTDERTDVWALATLFYELIAGSPPFDHPNLHEVLRAVVASPPPYPRRAVGVDGRLWSILMSALRKDPEDRTRSAAILRAELEAWAANEPASGQALTSAQQLARTLAPTLVAPVAPAAPAVTAPSQVQPSDASPMDALIRTKLGG